MPTLFYQNQFIPYTLKSSRRRRTLALRVDFSQQVTVLAPHRLSMAAIDRFLQTRAEWVVNKLAKFAEAAGKYPPKTYASGESFLFRGHSYRLQVTVDSAYRQPHIERIDGYLIVRVQDETKTEQALQECYKKEAETLVKEAINRLALPHGLSPLRVGISNPKRRWGSCSSRGNLRFNWRVALMPPPALDYIVAHELAHMKIFNHSATFWKTVQIIFPDYAAQRHWLRNNNLQFTTF